MRSIPRHLTCLVALACLALPTAAWACPFCSAVSLTFAQEIAQSDAAVIVKLVEPPPTAAVGPSLWVRSPRGSSRWSR